MVQIDGPGFGLELWCSGGCPSLRFLKAGDFDLHFSPQFRINLHPRESPKAPPLKSRKNRPLQNLSQGPGRCQRRFRSAGGSPAGLNLWTCRMKTLPAGRRRYETVSTFASSPGGARQVLLQRLSESEVQHRIEGCNTLPASLLLQQQPCEKLPRQIRCNHFYLSIEV